MVQLSPTLYNVLQFLLTVANCLLAASGSLDFAQEAFAVVGMSVSICLGLLVSIIFCYSRVFGVQNMDQNVSLPFNLASCGKILLLVLFGLLTTSAFLIPTIVFLSKKEYGKSLYPSQICLYIVSFVLSSYMSTKPATSS